MYNTFLRSRAKFNHPASNCWWILDPDLVSLLLFIKMCLVCSVLVQVGASWAALQLGHQHFMAAIITIRLSQLQVIIVFFMLYRLSHIFTLKRALMRLVRCLSLSNRSAYWRRPFYWIFSSHLIFSSYIILLITVLTISNKRCKCQCCYGFKPVCDPMY